MFEITCLDSYGIQISHLTQWDYGQTLIIDNINDFEYDLTQVNTIHFCNRLSPTAIPVTATINNNRLSAPIPNELLTVAEKIFVYIFLETENSGKTIYTIELPVRKRKKPDDIIYPDDEPVGHYATEEWVLEAIEEVDLSDYPTFSDMETAFEENTNQNFEAVLDENDELDTDIENYEDIKEGDLITETEYSGNARLWKCVEVGANEITAIQVSKEIASITGVPQTTTQYSKRYAKGQVLFSNNGKIYLCESVTSAGVPPVYTYTWRVYQSVPSSIVQDAGKFLRVNAQGQAEWETDNKQDKTVITTDSESTTASLLLIHNQENRYTQDLTSLTLTLSQTIEDDFISSIIFSSGSTATQITYDSSIKWSGDDVTSNAFVPQSNKTYNIVIWYDGINVNAVARGV